MGKFKLCEILLFVAVVLLAALVYETHNDGGRYVLLPPNTPDSYILDTRTGKVWVWKNDSNT